MNPAEHVPTETPGDHPAIYRYPARLYQPWNALYAEFEVVTLPGLLPECCPNQSQYETPRQPSLWMNGMNPDIQPVGQCGQCGKTIYPNAAIVGPGEPAPAWLNRAAQEPPTGDCSWSWTGYVAIPLQDDTDPTRPEISTVWYCPLCGRETSTVHRLARPQ